MRDEKYKYKCNTTSDTKIKNNIFEFFNYALGIHNGVHNDSDSLCSDTEHKCGRVRLNSKPVVTPNSNPSLFKKNTEIDNLPLLTEHLGIWLTGFNCACNRSCG